MTIQQQRQHNYLFHNLYACDTRFQLINKPTVNQKSSYSGKHKLHGFKTEVSVAYPGNTIWESSHFPGKVNDLTIFLQHYKKHLKMTTKRDGESNITDLFEQHPIVNNWAILVNKGI